MNDVIKSYKILGVTPSASAELTKQAYRKLAKTWHPDRYVNDPILKVKAEIEIKKINQAYAIVKAYQAQGNMAEGLSNIAHASATRVTKSQHTPEFYYQQGITYLESEDYDAALQSLAQGIKLNPDYLEAYQCRGFIFSKLGFNLRADAEFKKAHQIRLKQTVSTAYHKKYTPQAYQEQVYTSTATSQNQTISSLDYQHTIIGFEQPISDLIVSVNGQIASISGEPEINLWQLNTGRRLGILKGHQDRVTCLAMSHSGLTLISGSQDKTIRFWDLKEQKIIRTFGGYFDGHLSQVVALGLTPDNQTLISCGGDNSLKIWDVNRATEKQNIAVAAAVTCLAISPDGQLFVTGGLETQLMIRSTNNGQVIRSLNNNSGVLSVAFSPDGNLLATGGFNCHLKLWDLTTGKEIYTLMGHSDRVSKVMFSNDGRTLISCGWDCSIKSWKLATGKIIHSLEAHTAKINSMAIAPNERNLVSGSADCTIKVWQLL